MDRESWVAERSWEWEDKVVSATEIMTLIRREPREVILEIGELLDELRGDLVDEKFAAAVEAGRFDELAAQALGEHAAGKTIPLDEFLAQR